MGEGGGRREGGMYFAERTLPNKTSSTSSGLMLGTLSRAAGRKDQYGLLQRILAPADLSKLYRENCC